MLEVFSETRPTQRSRPHDLKVYSANLMKNLVTNIFIVCSKWKKKTFLFITFDRIVISFSGTYYVKPPLSNSDREAHFSNDFNDIKMSI